MFKTGTHSLPTTCTCKKLLIDVLIERTELVAAAIKVVILPRLHFRRPTTPAEQRHDP